MIEGDLSKPKEHHTFASGSGPSKQCHNCQKWKTAQNAPITVDKFLSYLFGDQGYF